MTYHHKFIRSNVFIQPVLRLVDVFEESIAYERSWKLPFNALSFCLLEDPDDPSWCELPEKKQRFPYKVGTITFTTCNTPMRIRFTSKNLHCCIHFRYDLFPGVDLFSDIKERYTFTDDNIANKIKKVFSEPDPLRYAALAESAAMEAILKFWPEKLPLDIEAMAQFDHLLKYIKTHLTEQCTISEMAALMGWSEGYFSRRFHQVFHITPKQYLLRELFTRAMGELSNPHKSIKEIAGELNFSSEFNFSRFIKHYSGCYPNELRKNNQKQLHIKK